MTIECELAALLRKARLSDRQARAVSARLGWDGMGGRTLVSAGSSTGYTRERVRQLEEQVRRHLAVARPPLPLTRHALGAIAAVAPARREEVAMRLAGAGIAELPFDPHGVLRAAELAGLEPRVRLVDGIVLSPTDGELTERALVLARRLARRLGAVDLEELLAALAGAAGAPGRLRGLLDLRREVRWLDPERRWLALRGQPTGPERRLRKMLAVSPTLTLADVEDGLRRERRRPVHLPRDVLRSFCASLDWLELDPGTDTVSAGVPLDPTLYLSPLERELVELVRKAGPVVRLTRAARLAEGAGLNPASVTLYLVQSPALQTVGRGRYSVRGAALEQAA